MREVAIKDADGQVCKDEYLRIHGKICIALVPDISKNEAHYAGAEDWRVDSRGLERLTLSMLEEFIFKVADVWCSGVDANECANSRLAWRVLASESTAPHLPWIGRVGSASRKCE